MTEGMEDFSAGPTSPPAASPITDHPGAVPKEKPEEEEADGRSREEDAEGAASSDGEHLGALGIVALPGTCCVCVEMEQINNCLHSEKICILPILACLLSLALCTAGLKWVFVDKIFEYDPPTHLDAKRIGQDPIIISVDPTLGLTVSIPHLSSSTVTLTTAITTTPGRPDILVEEKPTGGPSEPRSPAVTQSDPSIKLKYNAQRPTSLTPHRQTTQEINDIIFPTISAATSTTAPFKTSSHVTRCSDSQRNYCVNGGECFTLEIMPGSTKFLCRCPNEFTGDRCQNYVMASFYKAEELYQKRILTITGICIALLVVGIMCVVAYCKTKKQRRKLQDHLRQSLRKKRSSKATTGIGPNLASLTTEPQTSNLPLQDLQRTNQCNGTTKQHAAEKDSKPTFTVKYESSVCKSTTFNHISSQRFVSTPTQLPLVSPTSIPTPGSPPSEASAPSLDVPSVCEEERPLLLLNGCPTHTGSSPHEHKSNSAHYNHGHEAHSLPPSPLDPVGKGHFHIIGDHDTTAATQMFLTSPEELHNSNNMNVYSTKREGVALGLLWHNAESSRESLLVGTHQGKHSSVLPTQSSAALLLSAMDSSRTKPTAANDGLQLPPPNNIQSLCDGKRTS